MKVDLVKENTLDIYVIKAPHCF